MDCASFESANLLDDSVFAEIVSPAFEASYPSVIHKDRIPQSTLGAMEVSWKVGSFVKRKVRLALLCNVFVAGEGIVFTQDHKPIAQLLTQQTPEHIQRAADELNAVIATNKLRRIAAPTVLCIKPGWQNYGHWLMEMLPIADLANRVICDKHLQYLFAAKPNSKMEHVIYESVAMAGLSPNRLFRYEMTPLFFEKLICVLGLSAHGTYMSPLIFSLLERMRESVVAGSQRRIYVKRKASLPRTFDNETEIDDLVRAHGYAILSPEDYSLAEQIALFKGAKKIVGIAGAAMTNICFCCSGSEVVTFYPEKMPDTFFWFIANHKRLRFIDYRCQQIGASKTHSDWDSNLYVDPIELVKFL